MITTSHYADERYQPQQQLVEKPGGNDCCADFLREASLGKPGAGREDGRDNALAYLYDMGDNGQPIVQSDFCQNQAYQGDDGHLRALQFC